MHIVYWAHSYRDDDAAINEHFGVLIEQAEQMIINLDPPSPSVNESKLDQNLRSCDGMVAVLTSRATGPSQYILYEIGLSLRARKPVIAFLDDRIGGDVLPARILQRRFSYRTYFRQFREHTDALRALKNYMGDPPPSRYQPRAGQRTCGLVGLGARRPQAGASVHHGTRLPTCGPGKGRYCEPARVRLFRILGQSGCSPSLRRLACPTLDVLGGGSERGGPAVN
jgi:hypothetical protein